MAPFQYCWTASSNVFFFQCPLHDLCLFKLFKFSDCWNDVCGCCCWGTNTLLRVFSKGASRLMTFLISPPCCMLCGWQRVVQSVCPQSMSLLHQRLRYIVCAVPSGQNILLQCFTGLTQLCFNVIKSWIGEGWAYKMSDNLPGNCQEHQWCVAGTADRHSQPAVMYDFCEFWNISSIKTCTQIHK